MLLQALIDNLIGISVFHVNRNLVDAANIAALAALLTFRRPECTLGGEDGQEVIVHPPEVCSVYLYLFYYLQRHFDYKGCQIIDSSYKM